MLLWTAYLWHRYHRYYIWMLRGHPSHIPPFPDSKVHGANMGPIWGRQDPGGPHVDPMNFVLWVDSVVDILGENCLCYNYSEADFMYFASLHVSVAILPRVRPRNILWWIQSHPVSLTPSPEAVHFCCHIGPIIWGLLTPLTADMWPHVWWNVMYGWIRAKEAYDGW